MNDMSEINPKAYRAWQAANELVDALNGLLVDGNCPADISELRDHAASVRTSVLEPLWTDENHE